MRTQLLIAALAALAVVSAGFRFAQAADDAGPKQSVPEPTIVRDPQEGALTTLRVVDDLTATVGFPSGAHGFIVEENELRNRISHLAFGRWVEDSLVVGIQGGSVGVIKDIGDVRLRKTDCSVLPFLVQRDGTVFDSSSEKSSLKEAGVSIEDEARSQAASKVHLGHVYLIRIDDPDQSLFVAARVVEHTPGQHVTIRWRML